MEIPSSHAGVVKEVKVKVGDKVVQGQRRSRRVESTGGARRAAAPRAARRRAPRPRRPPAPRAPRTPRRAAAPRRRCRPRRCRRTSRPPPSGALPHASPTIRKLARELGVPLDEVKGSGPKGRITQDDVQGFVKG